jgi:hypothetical protein
MGRCRAQVGGCRWALQEAAGMPTLLSGAGEHWVPLWVTSGLLWIHPRWLLRGKHGGAAALVSASARGRWCAPGGSGFS